MQWQLIPETTMIAINKLMDQTGADPEMTGN
jgi:hypothetical protein